MAVGPVWLDDPLVAKITGKQNEIQIMGTRATQTEHMSQIDLSKLERSCKELKQELVEAQLESVRRNMQERKLGLNLC